MNVIIYSSPTNDAGDKLKQVATIQASDLKVEFYHSILELSHRLHKPLKGDNVGIFFPSDFSDLLNLLSIQDLFRNIRIILVLPDREENTISAGHALRPRFLSYADCDFSDVEAVMDKMFINNVQCENQLIH